MLLGAENECECRKCNVGKHSNETGLAECLACDAGLYQDKSGENLCMECPAGQTSEDGSSKCTSIEIFTGIPDFREIRERDTLEYIFQLGVKPATDISKAIKIEINIIGDGCKFKETPETEKSDLFTKETDHFTLDSEKKVVIEGLSHPSGATAKGSILFSCQIEHILKTQIQTDLNYFAAGYKQLLQADVVSTGCGLGESFSQEINRTNEWECLCGPRFYKPPRLECLDCPPQGLICNKIGTKIPAVAPGFWRENPLSEDFETYPLYVCTYDSCGGGNSSHNLCVDGYTGVLCATCANEYVFQFGVCTSCPGYVSDGGATTPPPQLLLAALLSLFVAVIGIYVYFTQPALKKTEIHDLRMKLSQLNFKQVFPDKTTLISPLEFEVMADEMYGNLTENEIRYMFHFIDKDKSGLISRKELIVSLNF